MLLSTDWLKEAYGIALPPELLAERLTMAGLEVDSMERAAPEFSGVVVAQVLTLNPHPDADKLRVASVDSGHGEPLQVVCGAPNVAVGVKVPVRLAARAFVGAEVGQAGAVRDEDFCRAQALDFAFECVQCQGFAEVVARAADVRPGEVVVFAGRGEAEENVVTGFVQQGFVGEGAGGDDAGDGALDRPFGKRRVADLFADDGGLALFDEFGDVVVDGMHRHARHRDGFARALAAGGDADAEEFAAAPRVVKEEFVEVAHAVEDEGVRVVFFDAEVLLHHRRVRGVFHGV